MGGGDREEDSEIRWRELHFLWMISRSEVQCCVNASMDKVKTPMLLFTLDVENYENNIGKEAGRCRIQCDVYGAVNQNL